ncbi:DNA cytosine methyltransferase [Nocardia thailandica]|uniref:DNA cytosine methyltransferase n=1 Tax=Nocardia thailandica TaxID=257275 RepID=UPI0002FDBC3B|nr:DNA cytosine methyltransferase [Nocardia thailandica]
MSTTKTRARTATHRPATRQRRFRHDDLIAVDLFSGFGGLTQGIEAAGFTTIMAANHNDYKVQIHEANHPHAEHWIANLVDPESADYHSARDLPAGDLLVAGVSCVNHSQANTKKAYEQGANLFDLDDPEFDERVTRSERDRATANCVLHYADRHRPRVIIVECTTELVSWGPAIPGRKKIGDGTTYRWWLKQFDTIGYEYRELRLNSMFFGVPQSRDRLYVVFWQKHLPTPDLDHCPLSWCHACDQAVEAVWSWKTGIPLTGAVRYGSQYNYRCPRCRREVVPPMSPSLNALDLSDLGTRIGDRTKPLAPATMARAERCRARFAEFPAVLMPAKSVHGVEKHLGQPMATQTSQQETALLSTGPIAPPATVATGTVMFAHRHNGDGQHFTRPMDTVTATEDRALLFASVTNYQGAPRGVDAALPTQPGSETLGVVTGIIPFRKNTRPTIHAEAMPTVTSEQIPGLLTAAGWFKQNGSGADATAPHPVTEPFGTLTSRDTTGLVVGEWRDLLAEIQLEDCYFRMLRAYEVGRGCGFDPDFGDQPGTFKVWGSARNQVDGYGNAVSPAVGEWLGRRLRAVLHGEQVAA